MANSPPYAPLTRRADFLELKSVGRHLHINEWLLVNWRKSDRNQLRCGWTIPRQVGPAVVRNRFKRWGREFFRAYVKENPMSLDLNMVFKRREKGFYASIRHKEFDEALGKLVAKFSRDHK